MTHSAMLLPTANVDQIQSLDLLRGFGVLGILAKNIQAYSMILVAAFNPSAYGDLTGLNKPAWFCLRLGFSAVNAPDRSTPKDCYHDSALDLPWPLSQPSGG